MEIENYDPSNSTDEKLIDEFVRIAGIVYQIEHGNNPVSSDGHDSERLAVLKKIVLGRMIKDEVSSLEPVDGKPAHEIVLSKLKTILPDLRAYLEFKTESPGSANFFCETSNGARVLIDVLSEMIVFERDKLDAAKQIHELRSFGILLPELQILEDKFSKKPPAPAETL
ncbi:MAG: hypothetical protein ABR875_02195 [Minisyncoccia bacterium]|jgi:hypothetical protein